MSRTNPGIPRSRFWFRVAALAILLIPVLLIVACTHRADLRSSLRTVRFSTPEGRPQLLAVYQPWFGTREHVNVGYSSQDRAVLQRQIENARNLGISGFLVNWYGPRKEYMDRSYALMQRTAAENNFKVAIQYDESIDSPGHETEAVIVDLQYAYDRYIAPQAGAWRSAYLRYEGKPIIFIFPKTHKTDWSRVRQVTQSWEDPPLLIMKDLDTKYPDAFDGFYAWVNPGVKGWQHDGRNWGEQYLENFYSRMRSRYPDKIPVGAAWPGFDDKSASWSRNRYMDARCGRTFEDSLRVFRRYYNDQHPLPFLLIVTWNDYEEGTAIERGLNTCNGKNDAQKNAAISGARPDSEQPAAGSKRSALSN
jgi:hypothetical protein